MQHMFTKITPSHDDWWQPSSSHQEVRVWQAWGRRLLREASFGWRWKRRTFGQYQGLPWKKVCVDIELRSNHLLLPSTMFSSVLRTLSKSCLRESLRSSIAGKIRARNITTWTEGSERNIQRSMTNLRRFLIFKLIAFIKICRNWVPSAHHVHNLIFTHFWQYFFNDLIIWILGVF